MTRRAYTDVVGDLFHWGHVELFRRARESCGYLVVGVMTDELVEGYKRRPVLSMQERAAVIAGCRYVDEVIMAAPSPLTREFLEEQRIDVVIRGDDMSEEQLRYWYSVPMAMNRFELVPYSKGISTSDIIERCVSLYGVTPV